MANKKFFILNEDKNPISKEEKEAIDKENIIFHAADKRRLDGNNRRKLEQPPPLKHVEGRIIVQVDIEKKNSHKFSNGTEIRLERKYNEFNRRITEPVNAIVISAENIPAGSEILIGHNALHEVNKITDYKKLAGGEDANNSIRYYSLPEDDCYAWLDTDGNLMPMKNFEFAFRVFKSYKGILTGIEPSLVNNVLYITTGELAGNVCHVLKASDYTIIYQGKEGREKQVIRCRHFSEKYDDKQEIIAIAHGLTEKVNSGELLIGLYVKDAKPLNEFING